MVTDVDRGAAAPAPRMVGREAELARLRARILDAVAGTPSLTLLEGDAGVGKSRLALEAERLAREAGLLTLAGNCLELSVGELPYAPLAGALRDVDPDAADVAEALAALPEDGRREIARIVPDVVPGVDAPPPEEDRFGQSRLFGWLLALLRQLSLARPVLLRIEDLQSADPSSRDFLRFLVQSARAERLALVVTVRLDELPREHPVRALLAELGRSPLVTRCPVGPLSRAEVAQQVAQLTAGAGAELVDRVYARSEGNPFYVEELLAGVESDDGVPASLRDALLAHRAGLSDDARQVLAVAAVAARPVDDAMTAAAADLSPERADAALRACVDRQLLVCDRRTGTYSVRHALLREAVYEDLLPARRVALHRALASELERAPSAENAADRAHHWTAAREPGPALGASIAAADAAEAVFGYGEALAHAQRALALWGDGEPPAPMAFDKVSLLARAAQAARWVGSSDLACELCEAALQRVDAKAEPLRAARLHERLGRYRPWDIEGSLAHYREALALIPVQASADRMRLLADEALALSFQGDWGTALRRAQEAIDLAGGEATLAIESAARAVLGVATAFLEAPARGEPHLREALELATRARSTEDLAQIRLDLGELLRLDGRVQEALAVMLDGELELAGVGFAGSYGNYMAANAAEDLLRLGRWDELSERLQTLSARALDRPAELLLQSVAGRLAAARGDSHAAQQRFDQAVELCTTFDLAEYVPALYAGRAELALWSGDPLAARTWIEEGLEKVTDLENLLHLPGLWAMGARVQAELAELARLRREPDGAAQAISAASRHAQALGAACGARGADAVPPEATAQLATCEAEARRAAGEPDPAAWREAVRRWVPCKSPYPLAYASFRLAESLVSAGTGRAEARAALQRAAEVADRLRARPLGEAVAGFARRARLSLDLEAASEGTVVPAGPGDGPEPPGGEFDLTPRELEVLALVAAGMTNREISARLFISPHTAGVHVSHILAKLGVANRTLAATAAQRLGLLG
jgi:DNA-binding CsgD family transcriptional regulator/tetratricopeptide (TPR) repeat protein